MGGERPGIDQSSDAGSTPDPLSPQHPDRRVLEELPGSDLLPATTIAELLDRRRRDTGLGMAFDDRRWTWQEVVAQSSVEESGGNCKFVIPPLNCEPLGTNNTLFTVVLFCLEILIFKESYYN
jgi:hypothetical protein